MKKVCAQLKTFGKASISCFYTGQFTFSIKIFLFKKFIYLLFLAVLSLRCCTGFYLVVVSRDYSPVMCEPLITEAPLVAEY